MKEKKRKSFGFWGYICLRNVINRHFYRFPVYQGIFLWEYIEISTFSYTKLFPRVTQLPSETLFITTIYTYILKEIV